MYPNQGMLFGQMRPQQDGLITPMANLPKVNMPQIQSMKFAATNPNMNKGMQNPMRIPAQNMNYGMNQTNPNPGKINPGLFQMMKFAETNPYINRGLQNPMRIPADKMQMPMRNNPFGI